MSLNLRVRTTHHRVGPAGISAELQATSKHQAFFHPSFMSLCVCAHAHMYVCVYMHMCVWVHRCVCVRERECVHRCIHGCRSQGPPWLLLLRNCPPYFETWSLLGSSGLPVRLGWPTSEPHGPHLCLPSQCCDYRHMLPCLAFHMTLHWLPSPQFCSLYNGMLLLIQLVQRRR